jgi:hypothetical protein
MTHHASNTSETNEIEFTAAYGTAVAMIGARRPTLRGHRQEALELPLLKGNDHDTQSSDSERGQ